jgi:hypothetical protein
MGPMAEARKNLQAQSGSVLAMLKERKTHHFHFRFDRQRNMELTATNALNILRKFVLPGPVSGIKSICLPLK